MDHHYINIRIMVTPKNKNSGVVESWLEGKKNKNRKKGKKKEKNCIYKLKIIRKK